MTAILITIASLAIFYGAIKTWFGGAGRGAHQVDSAELPLALKNICQSEIDPELARAQALYNEWIESEKTDVLRARARLEKRAAQKRLREARRLVDAQPHKAKVIKMKQVNS